MPDDESKLDPAVIRDYMDAKRVIVNFLRGLLPASASDAYIGAMAEALLARLATNNLIIERAE